MLRAGSMWEDVCVVPPQRIICLTLMISQNIAANSSFLCVSEREREGDVISAEEMTFGLIAF